MESTISWDQLKKAFDEIFPLSYQVLEEPTAINSRILSINIYRPLRAYSKLRTESAEYNKLKPKIERSIQGLTLIALNTPSKTMGELLASGVDISKFDTLLTRVQAQSADLNNAIQQTGAFAFAILALYISVLSLIATVMFGLLPMIR